MTVTRRLLLLMIPALTAVMFGATTLDYLITKTTTRNAYDKSLASSALMLAAYLRFDGERVAFELPPTIGPTQARWPAREFYSIIDARGTLVAGNAQLPDAKQPSGLGEPAYFDGVWRGQQLRIASLVSQGPAGPVTITVAETLEVRMRTERAMLLGKLMVDFGELDVMLLLIWAAVYYGLRPLRQLHDRIEASMPRELQRFDETHVPGEVRPLVGAFNKLLEIVRDAADAQRRFIADAAHQLRTPVAGVMAQLELLLQQPAAAAVIPELARIDRAIAHLSHSANQLLALARVEPLSMQPEQFKPVSLRPLIEELVERNVDRAEKQGLDLGAEAQAAEVVGDVSLLDDLASNLIDNSLKYTPRGGHVTVRCGCATDGKPYLVVEDDGPGIPEAERSRVRERFYRRPGSVGAGCGLGLAIVDEITRVHHASFSIEDGSGGKGTKMTIAFPAPDTISR
jgi:two-component system sensor histidine kinase TctE